MKVASVLFDNRFGGPGRRAIEVAAKLKPFGIDTTVVLPDAPGDTADLAEAAGLDTLRVGFQKIPRPSDIVEIARWGISLPRDAARFCDLFRANGFNLVHVTGAIFLQPGIGARLARLPLIWHFNDTIVPTPLAPMTGKFCSLLAAVVIVEARAVARHYDIPPGRATVVYAPVDTGKFRPQVKTRDIKEFSNPARIGLIANWSWVKGIEYFVRAMDIVRGKIGPSFRAIIVGRQYDNHAAYNASVLREIKLRNLHDLIEIRGFRSDVETIIPKLDLLVLPSVSEACPQIVLEAMACQVPVVATDVGGVRELLLSDVQNPAGVVIPRRKPEAIAEAVINLIHNHVLALKMGRQGRRLAQTKFSLDICVNHHLNLYRRVAG